MRMLSVLALITLASFLTGCNGDSDDAPVTDPPAATNGEEAPATPAVNTEETETSTETSTEAK